MVRQTSDFLVCIHIALIIWYSICKHQACHISLHSFSVPVNRPLGRGNSQNWVESETDLSKLLLTHVHTCTPVKTAGTIEHSRMLAHYPDLLHYHFKLKWITFWLHWRKSINILSLVKYCMGHRQICPAWSTSISLVLDTCWVGRRAPDMQRRSLPVVNACIVFFMEIVC